MVADRIFFLKKEQKCLLFAKKGAEILLNVKIKNCSRQMEHTIILYNCCVIFLYMYSKGIVSIYLPLAPSLCDTIYNISMNSGTRR